MKKKDFERLKASVQSMVRILNGESTPEAEDMTVLPPLPDDNPAAVRARLELTQKEFAALLNIPVRTVQGWEGGRRQPDPAARTLLRVAATAPQVLRGLRTA